MIKLFIYIRIIYSKKFFYLTCVYQTQNVSYSITQIRSSPSNSIDPHFEFSASSPFGVFSILPTSQCDFSLKLHVRAFTHFKNSYLWIMVWMLKFRVFEDMEKALKPKGLGYVFVHMHERARWYFCFCLQYFFKFGYPLCAWVLWGKRNKSRRFLLFRE